MAEKDAPSPSGLGVHGQPEAQLEAKPQVKPEPVQPEAQLESQGDSQVTSASTSSTPQLLSASGGSGESPPQERSPELSPPLSFQRSLPETLILVERSLSALVFTSYPGKHRLGSKESREESLPVRPYTDPYPGALVPVTRVRASKSVHVLSFDEDIDSSQPEYTVKPQTIPSVLQSREISKDIEREQQFIKTSKVPPATPIEVSCIYIHQFICMPLLYFLGSA